MVISDVTLGPETIPTHSYMILSRSPSLRKASFWLLFKKIKPQVTHYTMPIIKFSSYHVLGGTGSLHVQVIPIQWCSTRASGAGILPAVTLQDPHWANIWLEESCLYFSHDGTLGFSNFPISEKYDRLWYFTFPILIMTKSFLKCLWRAESETYW